MYFAEHSLAVEIDELGQTDRNENYEKKKEKKIIEGLGCTILRIKVNVEFIQKATFDRF